MAYSTRADLESQYGRENIEIWARLGDGDSDSDVDDRITAKIVEADAEIDDRLRGSSYEVPFVAVPTTIQRLSAKLAGVLLYEARGVVDFNTVTGAPNHRLSFQREECERILQLLVAGAMELEVAGAISYPEAVDNTPTYGNAVTEYESRF